MAIQIPNPGTGNGQTGDNEYVLWSKVKTNFEDQTHAASRTVGLGSNQLLEPSQAYKAVATTIKSVLSASPDFNSFAAGDRVYANRNSPNSPNTADADHWLVTTKKLSPETFLLQNATEYKSGSTQVRVSNDGGITWTAWQPLSTTKVTYSTTTAAGANVVVDTNGKLMRSTSSERYKDILADLELDDEAYKNAMQLAPIVYRSTAEADNPDYHYYSFSAEKLGAFDPAFTLWRETETVTDDEGNTIEQPLAERVAEGININALLAFSHAIAIKQDKMIKAQAEAITTLTQRIDAMTT